MKLKKNLDPGGGGASLANGNVKLAQSGRHHCRTHKRSLVQSSVEVIYICCNIFAIPYVSFSCQHGHICVVNERTQLLLLFTAIF